MSSALPFKVSTDEYKITSIPPKPFSEASFTPLLLSSNHTKLPNESVGNTEGVYKPKSTADETQMSELDTATSSAPKTKSAPTSNSTYPLKEGSKGALVKQMQTALIKKYGKGILPKYGADGWFGKETTAALKSKGLKTNIDLTEFTKLIA